MQLAKRMQQLGTESAFDVLVRARRLEQQGRSVIHMEIGEPDFPTPPNIVEAAKRALDEGWTHYGPTQGYPELREAIAEHISATRGLRVGPERVCVVPGGKPIIFFPMLALIEPGDEVLYPDPGFPIYESMIKYLGGVPVALPLIESRGFSLDLEVLEARLSPRSKLLILNSPQNPTGGIIPEPDLGRVAELVRGRDLVVLSDEIYCRILYAERHCSIASFEGMLEKTILLDGFSKTYAMTGWRIGYGVMPVWLAAAVTRLMVNSNSCTASFTQRAAIEALRGPQGSVEAMVAEFRRRRDAIVQGLNTIPGFRCPTPGGAFYAFPNITGTGRKSGELADYLLEAAGVAALSGASFGAHGEGYLRFSYATSLENIEEAIRRVDQAVRAWRGPEGGDCVN